MIEPDWKWYVGYSDEVYSSGPYDTREEAVYIAREEFEGGWIVEAYKQDHDLSRYFDADRFLEDVNDCTYELMGEDGEPLFNVSQDQIQDLQQRVRAAIEGWQIYNNLVFTPWCFTGARNHEYIPGGSEDD